MSTFYLLPSRPIVGERFADLLHSFLPGMKWPSSSWAELAEMLSLTAEENPDVFIVHRDDLPEGEDTALALADGFGAEAGDEVVEVKSGNKAGEIIAHRWVLGE